MNNYEMIKSLSIEQMAMFMERVKMNRLNSLVFACHGSKVGEDVKWVKEECPEEDDET